MKTISKFLYNLIAISLIASILVFFTGSIYFAGGIAVALFLLQFVPDKTPANVLPSEVIRRLFSSDLQERLYPDNSFYAGTQQDTAAIDVEEIEIPQDEDGEAEVVVNPTQLPLPISIEEDKKKTYGADLLVTKPTAVTYNNQLLVSYDKRAAKLRKHLNSLDRQLAERIMYGWSPSVANFIRQTTGGTTRAATAPGATGTRKRSIEDDWMWAFTLFNTLNIPVEGRRVVVPPTMLEDIIAIKKAYGQGTDSNNQLLAKGAVTELFTFNVFVRSKTQVYTEAATPVKKAIGAATATTDNLAAIFYHTQMVRHIKGDVQVWMDKEPRGEYAGAKAMNAGLRGGGAISRLSEIGVAALVEDN
ncbi:hypothetical protein ACFQ21_00155 [Ohtaekwangia kribbensis]|uniref:Uncharacterized protein n=1 Tax=Ohtaekwangia kribbensis TaxID=688913 RepID=A0ABW3JVZ9_9BACT